MSPYIYICGPMTREDLELAALAAGHTVYGWYQPTGEGADFADIGPDECVAWAPHTDIADAARLAVRLDISVDIDGSTAFAHVDGYDEMDDCGYGSAEHDGTEADKERAYCEAITICAAAIGRRMGEGGR